MYDIESLERKWQKYRRKRMIRIAGWSLLIIVITTAPMAIYYYSINTEHAVSNGPKVSNKSIEVSAGVSNTVNKNKKTTSAPSPKQQAILANASVESQAKKTHTNMLIQVSDKSGKVEKNVGIPSKKKINLEVHDAKSTQVIKEIEARFPYTREYDDTIYLAKYYYSKHQYRKAEKWAMQANTIDSTQEESWILYAKSKAKQGHRAAALRILQAYYDQTGSLHVKMVIDDIRKGREF
ncbi:hypothetical protein [Nitratifractor salsuginis]|uniref:Transformation system protein n=1 Tax=Nitratifractor salsuginis (strain DSM 16511 / JCM 12458 / E9I37-1) TaxID=749222 RepID=E6X1X7_NITSE|nr:hypothetical protein [Nitratifractor salsuginis]ADV45985.1 hypothetical protein Nitsa_0718 [Nitratifractor salsuginis DSM 16511]